MGKIILFRTAEENKIIAAIRIIRYFYFKGHHEGQSFDDFYKREKNLKRLAAQYYKTTVKKMDTWRKT